MFAGFFHIAVVGFSLVKRAGSGIQEKIRKTETSNGPEAA